LYGPRKLKKSWRRLTIVKPLLRHYTSLSLRFFSAK
jgi:hypothetical protein